MSGERERALEVAVNHLGSPSVDKKSLLESVIKEPARFPDIAALADLILEAEARAYEQAWRRCAASRGHARTRVAPDLRNMIAAARAAKGGA